MDIKEASKKFIAAKFETEAEGNIISYRVNEDELAEVCRELYFTRGMQLKTITATKDFKIYYVFGAPKENVFLVPYLALKDTENFPSITPIIHEASGYERRIHSFFGLTPVGHPLLRGMLLHENWPAGAYPLRKDFDWQERPREASGTYEMQKVEGEGIYEIPVGPVHAGIIEPGHFRFSVAGEEILLLEAKLGYKHKGIEKLFEVLPSLEDKLRLSERVSGDSSFSHSLAFCQAIESLADIKVPEKAEYLRVIYAELERIANHLNDIGFIMLDTGYSFGGSNGARLREMVMRINERLTGSRFLRGVNIIGGVTRDLTKAKGLELLAELEEIHRDFSAVIEIAGNSGSVLNRLSGTGKIDRQLAADHGVIGVAGRAVGISHDARVEYPYAVYGKITFEVAVENAGDVQARWNIRVKEIHSSMEIIKQAIDNLPAGEKIKSVQKINLKNNGLGVGVVEGWRGDIVYFIVTDASGNIHRVDVRDPSFLNWPAVGHSGKGNVVPDFPLINKSFNLSYSGNDL